MLIPLSWVTDEEIKPKNSIGLDQNASCTKIFVIFLRIMKIHLNPTNWNFSVSSLKLFSCLISDISFETNEAEIFLFRFTSFCVKKLEDNED